MIHCTNLTLFEWHDYSHDPTYDVTLNKCWHCYEWYVVVEGTIFVELVDRKVAVVEKTKVATLEKLL